VGKVYHGKNAVDHGIAQGYQGVDAAQLEGVHQLLENIGHLTSPYLNFGLRIADCGINDFPATDYVMRLSKLGIMNFHVLFDLTFRILQSEIRNRNYGFALAK
jgi:hypothetical protein